MKSNIVLTYKLHGVLCDVLSDIVAIFKSRKSRLQRSDITLAVEIPKA